jgi:hypothetical protein
LKAKGIFVSHRIIGDALKAHGFSLQSDRKQYEGKGHADRDSQFEYIHNKVEQYIREKQPVISVDAKKRELVGNFNNKGVEWHSKGDAPNVNAYDFLTEATGVVIVSLIANTTTAKGLKVACEIDTAQYETGIEITKEQFEELNICQNGEWNYKISP